MVLPRTGFKPGIPRTTSIPKLGSGQYPKGDGTNVVAGDFAADVAAAPAVQAVTPTAAGAVAVGNGTGTDLVPAGIPGALFGMVNGHFTHRLQRGITVAASNSYFKWMADYSCDGVDDQIEWQAAIDEAQAALIAGNAMPVYILNGTYHWSAGIALKSAAVIGPDTTSGAIIYWDGPDRTTTAMTKLGAPTPFNSSSWRFENLRFQPGVNGGVASQPDVWLDFVDPVDAMCYLEGTQFIGGNTQIRLSAGWTNCHWRGPMRFDSWLKYALELHIPSGSFYGSFKLQDFTCDSSRTEFAPFPPPYNNGFVKFVLPAAPNRGGTVAFENARIEIDDGIEDPKGLWHFDDTANTAGVSPGAIHLRFKNINVAVDPSVGTCYLLSRDGIAGSGGSWRVSGEGVGMNGLAAILNPASNWGSQQAIVKYGPGGFNEDIAHLTMGNPNIIAGAPVRYYNSDPAGNIIETSLNNDTNPRLQLRADGRLQGGPGNAAFDVQLYRNTANTFYVDKMFQIGQHLTSSGAAPAIAAGTGAGTTPTVSVSGSDMAGTITVTTGTAPAASAVVATVTFNVAYSSAPKAVILTPAGSAAAALTGAAAVYEDQATRNSTTFKLNVGAAPLAASTTYKWAYQVIG